MPNDQDTLIQAARVITLPLLALLAGCAPKIDDMTVTASEPGVPVTVAADVTKNQTTIQGVELDRRPAGSPTWSAAGSMSGSGGTYTGQTPRLGPGDYEAQVRVRYKALFQATEKTKSATREFSLAWPPGTFGFETGGLNGWQYAGVFGAAGNFQQCSANQLTNPPFFQFTGGGYPLPIGDNGVTYPSGALHTAVTGTCYPDADSELDPQIGFWNFNLLSPDLSADAAWQGISGVSFRLATNVPFGVQAVATVVYEDANGENQPSSPMTSGSQVDFTTITSGDGWVTVEKTWNIPDRPVRSVEIRVFGDPESLQGGILASVLLDVVTPIS